MKKGYVANARFYADHLDIINFDYIAIPKDVLEKAGLKPGDPVEIRSYKDRISIKKQENKNE